MAASHGCGRCCASEASPSGSSLIRFEMVAAQPHTSTHTHTHTHIHTHDAPRRVFDFARVSGVHLIVSTPGRLKDLLEKKKINLDL